MYNNAPDTRGPHHHQGSRQPQRQNKMALTFGTLLSSQSTDAHPPRPLDRLGGNPGNTTRLGSQCQTARPGPRDLPSSARLEPTPCGVSLCGGLSLPGPIGTVAARLGDHLRFPSAGHEGYRGRMTGGRRNSATALLSSAESPHVNVNTSNRCVSDRRGECPWGGSGRWRLSAR